jgi:hypothetical protein
VEPAEEFIRAATAGRRSRASALLEAGAVIEPGYLELADGPLAEWLEARLRR